MGEECVSNADQEQQKYPFGRDGALQAIARRMSSRQPGFPTLQLATAPQSKIIASGCPAAFRFTFGAGDLEHLDRPLCHAARL